MRPDVHRSRTGCLTCRTRKVKCDEQRPVCQQCHRGTRSCDWPRHDAPVSPLHRPRRPNNTTCIQCREKKLRCVGELHNACTRCGRLGLTCRRPAVRSREDSVLPQPFPRVQLQPSPPVFDSSGTVASVPVTVPLDTLPSTDLPTGPELHNLIDLYFQSVHSEWLFLCISIIKRCHCFILTCQTLDSILSSTGRALPIFLPKARHHAVSY